ncbi:Complex III assembly factor lyrm7 [Quaeritorhiza haematococci]|nr:Complex III assembly factor lyrm7 [Quaeritorhiza haematococci]
MNSVRSRVLHSYKELLRSQRKVFAEDFAQANLLRIDARLYTREQYFKNKDVTEPAKLEELIKVAEDASLIIRRNVVQAVKKPGEDMYEVKFTEETEIRDNDSIKINAEKWKQEKLEKKHKRRCKSH